MQLKDISSAQQLRLPRNAERGMELHGNLAYNLQLALDSAARLRGHPVHRDTVTFWSDLIGEARARRAATKDIDAVEVDELIAKLERAIAETRAHNNS